MIFCRKFERREIGKKLKRYPLQSLALCFLHIPRYAEEIKADNDYKVRRHTNSGVYQLVNFFPIELIGDYEK